MNQDNSYPEPSQLQEFTNKPMPFHDIHASDLELIEDNKIRVSYENTEYVYHPTYFRIERAENDVERIEYSEWKNEVDMMWENGMDWEIQEDFICVTYLSDYQYEAYWVLENITINNPNLYN